MYTEADRQAVYEESKKRWLVTVIPGTVLVLAGIIVFIICQAYRKDWGWMIACACTILGGAYVIFLFGVYLKPVLLYKQHLGNMLDGRKRETVGFLKDITLETSVKDGLDAYGVTVNIGAKDDPEDERLFYYDARLDRPAFPPGSRVTILSNDKMISDIRGV
ncbi:MAG: hypothetical protein FWF86_04100 [Clostridia bacterium]|nr:hypothetical protein [Clostridia bacterium]